MDALVMNGMNFSVNPAEQDPLAQDYLAAEVLDRFSIAFTGVRLPEFMAEECRGDVFPSCMESMRGRSIPWRTVSARKPSVHDRSRR